MGFKSLLQLRRSLPASQPFACQPACYIILQTNHVSHLNRHIIQFAMGRNLIKQQKFQPTSGHSSSTSQTTYPHLTLQPQPIDQSNNQSNGSRIAWTNGCRDLEWRGRHFSLFFVGNCYELGMCYPAAKPGVEQCCSGEGFQALSSIFIATKQSIPTTTSQCSIFRDKSVYF